MNLSGYKIVVLLLVAVGVAVGATAIFTGGASGWQIVSLDDISSMNPLEFSWSDFSSSPGTEVLKQYRCPQCGSAIGWAAEACARCGWAPKKMLYQTAFTQLPCAPTQQPATSQMGQRGMCMTPAAATNIVADAAGQTQNTATAQAMPTTALLSPRKQNAAGKEFIEGHWLGLEVIPLVPELAKEFRIPDGVGGVLVDEITLEAAESGILAGDMVQKIDGRDTPDLKAFFLATLSVQEKEKALITVNRRGEKKTFTIVARNAKTLGFSQMEAAQPIQPGALSPHRSRGKACTQCHIIMQSGGQLPTDAGDILPNPPPISTNATAPHKYRGECSACHVIQ